jgi:cell division protein ZapB
MGLMHVYLLTRLRLPSYSCGMISEFQELSDKIDQLAEMSLALRRENAQLRQANAALVADNMACQRRLAEAHARVSALLEKIPAIEGAAIAGTAAPVQEDVQ